MKRAICLVRSVDALGRAFLCAEEHGHAGACRGAITIAEASAVRRADKARRGECKHCKAPVSTKPNGRPAALCETHLRADLGRKKGT